MKNILVVMFLTIFASAATTRFINYEGLGLTIEQAVDNGHVNLRAKCTGDMSADDGPVGTLSNITFAHVQTPSRYDVMYHVEMTATCSSKD